MSYFIPHSQKHPTWTAQSGQINDLLGLGPKGKLPEAGMSPRYLSGVEKGREEFCVSIKVWVTPLVRKANLRTSVHRVMCECPECGATLSIGRLRQHVCKA